MATSHITATNLSRLLSRLDRKLGFSTADAASPPTSLERAKIASNLEYARQLLLTLEKESDTIRNLTQRQNVLSTLGQQKAAIRRLNEKLQVIMHDGEAEDSDSGEDSDAGEQLLEAMQSDSGDEADEPPAYSLEPTTEIHRVSSPGEGLRNRFSTQKEERAALFPGSSAQAGEGEEFSEKELDSQRREQEALTADMLTLAQQLKINSVRFGEELQKEKGLLDLAAEGLDKNVLGIEGAGRKMDTLRRDENVGWLWSILYPVIIVALMFFTLFILFFAPKLRWW